MHFQPPPPPPPNVRLEGNQVVEGEGKPIGEDNTLDVRVTGEEERNQEEQSGDTIAKPAGKDKEKADDPEAWLGKKDQRQEIPQWSGTSAVKWHGEEAKGKRFEKSLGK
jgi:hypothetical protein